LSKPEERHLPATLEDSHQMIGDLLGEIRKMQARIDWLARKLFGRSSPSKNASPAPACWPT